MNNEQFHLILPSNSSMKYFPHNTTTRFTTQLPHEIRLQGRWAVGLTEIQFPRTFLHIRHESPDQMENRIALMTNVESSFGEEKNEENYERNTKEAIIIDGEDLLVKYSLPYVLKGDKELSELSDNAIRDEYTAGMLSGEWLSPIVSDFRPGVYPQVGDLVRAINQTPIAREHVGLIFQKDKDCYVKVNKICQDDCKMKGRHFLAISEKVSRILGFAPQQLISDNPHYANHPPSLARGLPQKMFVYCDICEPHITGDAQTPLLRIIPVDTRNYVFASTQVTQFSSPNYISLLHTEFRTIEIDIRDHVGLPIPFEFGTLTVTLHFKKID